MRLTMQLYTVCGLLAVMLAGCVPIADQPPALMPSTPPPAVEATVAVPFTGGLFAGTVTHAGEPV
jgi:hypothetical protein